MNPLSKKSLRMQRTAGALIFLGVGAALIGGNYFGIAKAQRARVGYSCLPILGGLSGCVGFLLIPRFRLLALLPVLVDPGCLMLLVLLWYVVRKGPDVRS